MKGSKQTNNIETLNVEL